MMGEVKNSIRMAPGPERQRTVADMRLDNRTWREIASAIGVKSISKSAEFREGLAILEAEGDARAISFIEAERQDWEAKEERFSRPPVGGYGCATARYDSSWGMGLLSNDVREKLVDGGRWAELGFLDHLVGVWPTVCHNDTNDFHDYVANGGHFGVWFTLFPWDEITDGMTQALAQAALEIAWSLEKLELLWVINRGSEIVGLELR